VRGGGVAEAEDAFDVDRLRAAELGGGHAGDGSSAGGPDAVVGDEDVEVAEGSDGFGDERCAVFGGFERVLDGDAVGRAAERGGEGFGLDLGGAIAESDACASLAEEADGGGADASRASGDEGGAAGEGERDGVG
jgi:hypothetical protein